MSSMHLFVLSSILTLLFYSFTRSFVSTQRLRELEQRNGELRRDIVESNTSEKKENGSANKVRTNSAGG